jgi:AP2-like factor (euAP2 lineage)
MSKSWCYITAGENDQVKIDSEDREIVEQHSWRVTNATTGRRRVVTSIRTPKGARTLTLGAFLMKPPPGKQVYPRRFNDELDYRKDNLIVCTLKERQQQLPKKRAATSSQYRGVSLTKSTGKWRAAIEVEGKSINLGSFVTEEEAALAYNRAAKTHFGASAYQNQLRSRGERRN